MKALPADAGEVARRALAGRRLAAYDAEVGVLVAYLEALAGRIETGTARPDDASRLRLEAARLRRMLPPDHPTHPSPVDEDG